MLVAPGTTLAARALLALLAGTAVGCGDDGGDGDEPDCTPTVEEYCSAQSCAVDGTRDDLLAHLLQLDRGFASLGECDGQTVIEFGDSVWSGRFAYDAASGELSGVDNVLSDQPQECDFELQVGEPIPDCDSCKLMGILPDGQVGSPCTGERAQPFIDACVQAPPELVADCAACACEHCYPAFSEHCEPDPSDQSDVCHEVGARCVLDHCDDCAMLRAAAGAGVPDP